MRRVLIACAAAIACLSGAGLVAQSAPARYSGLRWRLVGPFDGGTVTGVEGVAGRPGAYVVTAPHGVFETRDAGATWSAADIVPAAAAPRWADPTNPARIAEVDSAGIRVSLDGGTTWTTHHNLPIASVASTTIADGPSGGGYWIHAWTVAGETPIASGPGAGPMRPAGPKKPTQVPPVAYPSIEGHAVLTHLVDRNAQGLEFSGTTEGVMVSFDSGGHWASLQLNLPIVPVDDLSLHDDDLIASTDGRSVWMLDDISPLRAIARTPGTRTVVLFPPAPITLDATGHLAGRGASLDYYFAEPTSDRVSLEVFDRTGVRVWAMTSTAASATDTWAPLRAPLSGAAGGHRVVWNLRLDPPPAPSNRYRHLAPGLFASDAAGAPVGPTVGAGTYEVRLTVGTQAVRQSIHVVSAPWQTPAAAGAISARFDLARHLYDALAHADADALRLRHLRAAVKALTTATSAEVAQAATDFETRLADLDGSDWKFVLPDVDADAGLDFYDKDQYEEVISTAAAVSVTKDYDDPTTIIGSNFENANHPPAFAPVGDALATLLGKVEAVPGAPSTALVTDVQKAQAQLAAVQATWQKTVTADLAAFNQVLRAHGVTPIRSPAGQRP